MELETGHDFFGDGKPFASERERRESWCRHRRQLLAEWDTKDFPGERPQALWTYDADLDSYTSESEAVHALYAGPAEKRRIELAWLRDLEVVAWSAKPEHVVELASGQYGVPAWFTERHLAAILAKVAADRRGELVEMGDHLPDLPKEAPE